MVFLHGGVDMAFGIREWSTGKNREGAMGWSFLKKTIDPVCGKRINPVKAGIAAVHEGHAFFFCSRQCWATFQDTPSLYAGAPLSASKGWWGRYLQRVEKATQGKPPCCH